MKKGTAILIVILLIAGLIGSSIIVFTIKQYGDGGKGSSTVSSSDKASQISSLVSSRPVPETILDSGRNFDANKKGVPVLMYHNLVPDENKNNGRYSDNSITTALSEFDSQMKILFDHGYETIDCDTLLKFIKGEAGVPQKCLLITFDDGYKCVPKFAADVLRKYGFKATVFIFAGELQGELQEYTSEDLQYMRQSELEGCRDVFDFQCHLNSWQTHNDVKNLSIDEIAESIDLSHGTISSDVFAYPLGYYTEDYKKMISEKGFKMAFTIEKGYAMIGADPLLIPRFTVVQKTPAEQILSLVETGNRYS